MTSPSSIRLSFWTLVLFFSFSSFAFGCMEGWAIAACEVILFAGAAWAGWRDPEFWRWPRRLWLPALFVAVMVAIGIIQLVPLPASLWRSFHAERVAIYDEGAKAEALLYTPAYTQDPFAPAIQSAERSSSPSNPQSLPSSDSSPHSTLNIQHSTFSPLTPPAPSWLPASFAPAATARAIIALLAAYCLLLLLEGISWNRSHARRLMWTVGLIGLAVALAALFQHREEATKILGIRESAYAATAFGPFVNTNHGEAFVNLTFPFLYYLLWRRSLKQNGPANKWGIRILVLGLFLLHLILLGSSHSRGAYLALTLYPLVFLAHEAFKMKRWAIASSCVYALVLAGTVWLALSTGLLQDTGRLRLDANIPLKHWAIGNGLNGFEERFPAVVTDLPLFYPSHNTHLENEYLQVFFEAGALPALLGLGAALWAFLLAYLGVRQSHAAYWFVPAFASETLHASVDFIGHVFPIAAAYLLIWAILSKYGAEENDDGATEPVHRRSHGLRQRPERRLGLLS